MLCNICIHTNTQENTVRKNSVYVHYSPNLRIGDFSDEVNSWGNQILESRRTATIWLPLPCQQYGFVYSRVLSNKFAVGVRFQRGTYGADQIMDTILRGESQLILQTIMQGRALILGLLLRL